MISRGHHERCSLKYFPTFRLSSHFGAVAAVALLLAGCMHSQYGRSPVPDPAVVGPATALRHKLEHLKPPGPPVSVAVYAFPDMTGQHKYTPGLTYGDLSKAVTQGGGTLLMDILRSAGQGTWFEIVERAQVDDLLRERKIIEDSFHERKPRLKDSKMPPQPVLPAIRFADYLFAGGIIGYDRTISTGGAGASYLGISGNAEYQKDVVNVTLRLIDVLSGKVVSSVNTSKTIYSINIGAGLSRYVTVSNLLEINGGVSAAEPTLLAVREAMELALYQMLDECSQTLTWCVPRSNFPSRRRPAVSPMAAAAPPPSAKAMY